MNDVEFDLDTCVNRTMNLLTFLPRSEVYSTLVDDGATSDQATLVICAARILLNDQGVPEVV